MTVLPAVTVRFSSAGCRPAWESARVSRAFSCWRSRGGQAGEPVLVVDGILDACDDIRAVGGPEPSSRRRWPGRGRWPGRTAAAPWWWCPGRWRRRSLSRRWGRRGIQRLGEDAPAGGGREDDLVAVLRHHTAGQTRHAVDADAAFCRSGRGRRRRRGRVQPARRSRASRVSVSLQGRRKTSPPRVTRILDTGNTLFIIIPLLLLSARGGFVKRICHENETDDAGGGKRVLPTPRRWT